ncbi:Gfo/Idh/MocA family protein [Streptomyces sp. NPDC055189]
MSVLPLRFGILGGADIAVRRMLPAMAALPETRITAVASRTAAKAAVVAEPYGAAPVEGYEALLRRDDVDAVYIPLPAALHAEWAEAALWAGKHVLGEKPLTTDVAATARLTALAEGAGLALMENIMFLHHPLHEAVRGLVARGTIGEVRSFQAAFAIPPLPENDIRYDPELGGGALWDVGVYPLRAAQHFLDGQPGPGGDGSGALEVIGASLHGGEGRGVETSGAVLLRAPAGVTAQLTFGMEHAYRSFYELWGSAGRITVERAYTPPSDRCPVIRVECGGEVEEILLDPADQVTRTLRAFALSASSGTGQAFDRAAPLRLAQLLEAVHRAGRGR